MLGRFAAEALRNMQKNSSKPVKMKQFEFAARGSHHSLVESPGITEYMTLPVEEYALYDSTLMRRVSSDIFELSLPLPPSSGLGLQPTLRVRVLPAVNDTIEISSISARLTQDADAIAEALTGATGELSPAKPTAVANGASAGDSAHARPEGPAEADARAAHAASTTMGMVARSVELAFNTTLRWKSSTAIESATAISVETSARFSVELPPPFTMAPTPLVTGERSSCTRVLRCFVPCTFLPPTLPSPSFSCCICRCASLLPRIPCHPACSCLYLASVPTRASHSIHRLRQCSGLHLNLSFPLRGSAFTVPKPSSRSSRSPCLYERSPFLYLHRVAM